MNWTCTIASGHDQRMDTLAGLFIPLITPFTAEGDLAEDALEQLARRVLDDGAAGIVALGTTAEATALSDSEKSRVLAICSRVCRERAAPLIAGAGTNNTARSAAELAALAQYPDIRAALVVVPYYIRPGEAGVIEHFRTLAASSPVPLIIYNIPYRTGQQVGWRAMAKLAQIPGVAGVKHAVGAIDPDTIDMMASRPAGFSVLGGDDPVISPLLALGADGGIMASAHVSTGGFAALISMWQDGKAEDARELGHRLAPLSRALFAEPNPVVIKSVLHKMGQIPSPSVRLPLLPASPESTEDALRVVV
jgi:4-hydroxy-tetrahydrodipicolinate synthase